MGQRASVLVLVVQVGRVSVSSPRWSFCPIRGCLCLALVPCPYRLAWAGCCCHSSSWWWLILCLCLCGHNCVTSFCSAFLPFSVIHASVLCRVILDASNSLQLLYGSCIISPVSHWTSNSTELPECFCVSDSLKHEVHVLQVILECARVNYYVVEIHQREYP